MKKVTFSLIVLATTFIIASCGIKASAEKGTATDKEQAAEAFSDGNTFEGANFSLVYPKEFKETYASETLINAEDSTECYCHLDATYNDMGPTISQLKIYAENWVAMKNANDCTVDKPVIDGKVLTIRAVKDDETEIHFVVMKEDRIGIAGSLKFKTENEEKYKPVANSIISSIKFK